MDSGAKRIAREGDRASQPGPRTGFAEEGASAGPDEAGADEAPPPPGAQRDGPHPGRPDWSVALARLLSWVALLTLWQVLSTFVVQPFILPPPARIISEMVDIARSGQLLNQFGASLAKLGEGFVIFFPLGALVGTLMALSRWWEDLLRDAVSLAVSLPGLVYILVLLLIFGSSGLAPILAIVAAVTPYVILQFWEGVKGVPNDLLQMGRAFELSRKRIIRHIMLPALTPFILAAVTHGFSLGWRLVVLTEVFGGAGGVGFQMRSEFSRFSVAGVIAWAFLFYIFAISLDRLLLAPVSKRILRWREGQVA